MYIYIHTHTQIHISTYLYWSDLNAHRTRVTLFSSRVRIKLVRIT